MASVTSQLIEEVTAHARSDSLEDAREICADGTCFPNNLRTYISCPIFLIAFHFRSREFSIVVTDVVERFVLLMDPDRCI